MSATATCTHITAECPLSATLYGYRPNLAANIVLLAVFGLCAIAQLILGFRYKLRGFTIATTAGCVLEAVGYGGRILMHENPWSQSGLKTQLICLIIAPSFLAAGLYLTLKHLVLLLGREKSRLSPQAYPRIFVACDIGSICLQAIGGGIAAANVSKLLHIGDAVIIAGIAFQVSTMLVCICLAADFARSWRKSSDSQSKGEYGTDSRFASAKDLRQLNTVGVAIAVAFLAVFTRCVYRLPELSGGWGGPLQRDELEFLLLDGMMVAIAATLMTAAFPGPIIKLAQRSSLERYEMSPPTEFDESTPS